MGLWKFSELQRIEELSFNKVLERFHEYGVKGLIRENIQNSLDGKLSESESPVEVIIKTGYMKESDIPGLDEVFQRIGALKGGNQYSKDTIKHMQSSMDIKDIPFISLEDRNTKGLSGADKGHVNDPSNTYSTYAYSKGLHSIDDNEDFEKSRGGSHGIGKIASNAASDLYLMYFANCDESGRKHLGGTVQLIEHEYNGKCYRSSGYFTDEQMERFMPHSNNFGGEFEKNTRGLKIVIPYFRESFNDETEIIKGICDSFFLAILEKKLVVRFNELTIDESTISDIIYDERYYTQETREIKTDFTPLYLSTYKEYEKHEIIIKDKENQLYGFKLFFQYNAEIPKGRMAVIRTVGMKIEDRKILNAANKPFNAVLIPDGVNEDSFLKSLENESHTQLQIEHIKNSEFKKNAKRFLNNLEKEVQCILDEYIKKFNPVDGQIDTKDILYDIENKFKEDLRNVTSTVKINKGNNKGAILKIDGKNPDEYKGSDPKKGTEKQIRKTQRRGNGGDARRLVSVRPGVIRRVISKDDEILMIDLSGEDIQKGTINADLIIKVVDGLGKEYDNEFNVIESYRDVKDVNSNLHLERDSSSIKNITIKDRKINISMKTESSYNRTLKFSYYLEV